MILFRVELVGNRLVIEESERAAQQRRRCERSNLVTHIGGGIVVGLLCAAVGGMAGRLLDSFGQTAVVAATVLIWLSVFPIPVVWMYRQWQHDCVRQRPPRIIFDRSAGHFFENEMLLGEIGQIQHIEVRQSEDCRGTWDYELGLWLRDRRRITLLELFDRDEEDSTCREVARAVGEYAKVGVIETREPFSA